MFTKINVLRIVSDHWLTLHAADSERISLWDLLLFCGVPGIVVWLFWGKTALDSSGTFHTVALTSLSLFAGLLFNLLVLLYGLIEKTPRKTGIEDPTVAEKHAKVRNDLLREVYYNVSYAVLISVVAILSLVLIMIVPCACANVVQCLSSFLFFILAHFVLTLLMILKRIHALLACAFNSEDKK
jgi:uncharacterized Tic20 family protein